MQSKKKRFLAGYGLLVAASIGYELSIRVYDTGNSEFAGMLSTALTLPSSMLVALISNRFFGTTVGQSNLTFVVLLGLSGAINAAVVSLLIARTSGGREPE